MLVLLVRLKFTLLGYLHLALRYISVLKCHPLFNWAFSPLTESLFVKAAINLKKKDKIGLWVFSKGGVSRFYVRYYC